MAVRDGIRGTGFDAITTENTAAVVNVINLRVALPAADAHFIGIFGSFDIYAVGGAGGRADVIASRGGRQDPYFKPEACERRRDVLLILVSALVSTALVSIIPAARMALVLTAICGAALLIYLVLLVRLRSHATERETKLRYMPAQIEAPVLADRRYIAR